MPAGLSKGITEVDVIPRNPVYDGVNSRYSHSIGLVDDPTKKYGGQKSHLLRSKLKKIFRGGAVLEEYKEDILNRLPQLSYAELAWLYEEVTKFASNKKSQFDFENVPMPVPMGGVKVSDIREKIEELDTEEYDTIGQAFVVTDSRRTISNA